MRVRTPSIYPLEGRVQRYAWGSRHALPGFLGRHSDGEPWAEWWLGGHPQAPATVGSVPATTLDRLVSQDPATMLGAGVTERFGARLPFLLKVLAVAEPLSLQVHPTAEQAAAGFRSQRSTAGGAPTVSLYSDEWAKPEMLLALTRFDAFAGLRPAAAVVGRLEALGGALLATLAVRLRAAPTVEGLADLVSHLLTLHAEDRARVVAETRSGIERLVEQQAPESRELSVSAKLADRYPDDPAVLVTVLMNHVVLEPGEAMSVPAGLLHCYTRGLAVEIQGTSDNTLRAGLTAKHVDVDEVLRIVDAAAEPGLVQPGQPAQGLETFHAGADDFALDRICVPRGGSFTLAGGTPAIILAMDGVLHLDADGSSSDLRRGEAVFVPAAVGPIVVSGMGEAVRARPGLPEGASAQG